MEGTRLGRYLFLREIATGPLGPLYELRGEEEANGLNALGRVAHLSAELDADSEQAIVASAWEALELRHEHTLCVADVVFGKGWVTLVHDHAEGSLLRSLHQRAHERDSTFPVAVALRIVTDIIDGLLETRKLCESLGIAWTPGGTNPNSLYLCGDGRTRSLDGQLAVTLLRRDHAYAQTIEGLFSAPEVLSADKPLDERTDVFAAGAVLWELLTGLELSQAATKSPKSSSRNSAPKLNLAVPNSVKFPIGLARAVDAALESDPAMRIPTLAELKAAISRETAVAAYTQVVDFTDALLHRESTLFRLALDPTPKLSDELRANKPAPAHREWTLQLAKKAQFAPNAAPRPAATTVPWHAPAVSGRPKAPTLPGHDVGDRGSGPNRAPAESATRAARNVAPRQSSAQPAKASSNIANRTLIGISATAAMTGRDPVTAAATAPARVELPPATSTEAISEVQPRALPEPAAEIAVASAVEPSRDAKPVADQVLANVLFQDLPPPRATQQAALATFPAEGSPKPVSLRPAVTESATDVVSADDFVDDSFVRRNVVYQLTPIAIVVWSMILMGVTMIATLGVQRFLSKGEPATSQPAVVSPGPPKITTTAMAPAESTANPIEVSAPSATPVGISRTAALPEIGTVPQPVPSNAPVAAVAVAVAQPTPQPKPQAQPLPRAVASATPAVPKPHPTNQKRRYVPHGL